MTTGDYTFNGTGNFPVDGNWDKEFVKHEIIQYVLEVNKDHYKVYRNKSVELKLRYTWKRLDLLEKEIMESEICLLEDWDLAKDCFPLIEQYEFALLTAILAGKIEYVDTYMNLRNNIPVVNAGQFSEYLAGNYYLLRLYGISTDEDYEYAPLKFIFDDSNRTVCQGF